LDNVPQKPDRYLQYGGQAVIEGVMMRSPRFFAVACRKPDGTIVVQQEPVDKSIVGRLKWMNRPLLRGTLALIDAMALGMKALNYAASVQAAEVKSDDIPSGNGHAPGAANPTASLTAPLASTRQARINDIAIGATMVFSILVGIGLFIALPTFLTQLAQPYVGVARGAAALDRSQQVMLNLIDGFVRIAIFLGYIALISRLENIRRVFQYHGAEHKAINALEAGDPLTVDACMRNSRIHPRCGTSFIIVVLIASILVHSLFPRPPFYLTRLALHISLIPVVAGIAYEVIKLAGKYRHLALTSWLLAPGLWSQRLTTREPDAEHVEVAIAALQSVLMSEESVETAAVEAVPAPAAAVA
jgi:Predicted metal-dependent enzyme